MWKEGEEWRSRPLNFEGLTTCFRASPNWMITSGICNHLKQRWAGSREELTKWIWEEKVHQKKLEDPREMRGTRGQ